MNTSTIVLVSVVTLLLSAVVSWIAMTLLRRMAVMDVPNARSTHRAPVVRGVGVGPMLAASAGLGAAWASGALARAENVAVLLIGAATFGLLGLLDDLRGGLSVKVRFGSQLLAAGLCAGAVVVGSDLGILEGIVIWPVATMWLVSVVNAVNFMDGINGITAVTALVIGIAFSVLGSEVDDGEVLLVGGAVIAAVSLGFLPFNFPSARAFLGDVGSYFVGGWCALLCVLAVAEGVPLDAATFAFSLYLADTGTVLVKRYRNGHQLGTAHRDHVYQRLVDGGLSVPATTGLVGSMTAVLAALGIVPFIVGSAVRWATLPAAAFVLVSYLLLPRVRASVVPGVVTS